MMVGYAIVRSYKPDFNTRGMTYYARPHTIYPTEEEAISALALTEQDGTFDYRVVSVDIV